VTRAEIFEEGHQVIIMVEIMSDMKERGRKVQCQFSGGWSHARSHSVPLLQYRLGMSVPWTSP